MKYHIVTAGLHWHECPEIIETFTNKKVAKKEAYRRACIRDAANALRESEGSRERNRHKYYVVAGDDFIRYGETGKEWDTYLKLSSVIYSA